MPSVPFKLNQDRRHHIPKQKRKVMNWREYDAGLRQRGSLTVWFTDEAVQAWKAEPRATRGGQPDHSPLAILTALTLSAVSRLPFRRPAGLGGPRLRPPPRRPRRRAAGGAVAVGPVAGRPFRQTGGRIGSVIGLLGLDLAIPDHT